MMESHGYGRLQRPELVDETCHDWVEQFEKRDYRAALKHWSDTTFINDSLFDKMRNFEEVFGPFIYQEPYPR